MKLGRWKYDNLEVISENELPDNVIPLKFNTVEEAEAYIKNLEKMIRKKV